ncbi:hypothetical protein M231_00742 [Tremella mesenterica]|uniref:Zn(2)-C6 fungal-type domain-containing protein n=1 Tax=Tremella mesenterica TaxID=5217 RepID=A0A4Q1BV45_TREME|nr:hypothetical protein M231_00742 [Tremella mesenterica]
MTPQPFPHAHPHSRSQTNLPPPFSHHIPRQRLGSSSTFSVRPLPSFALPLHPVLPLQTCNADGASGSVPQTTYWPTAAELVSNADCSGAFGETYLDRLIRAAETTNRQTVVASSSTSSDIPDAPSPYPGTQLEESEEKMAEIRPFEPEWLSPLSRPAASHPSSSSRFQELLKAKLAAELVQPSKEVQVKSEYPPCPSLEQSGSSLSLLKTAETVVNRTFASQYYVADSKPNMNLPTQRQPYDSYPPQPREVQTHCQTQIVSTGNTYMNTYPTSMERVIGQQPSHCAQTSQCPPLAPPLYTTRTGLYDEQKMNMRGQQIGPPAPRIIHPHYNQGQSSCTSTATSANQTNLPLYQTPPLLTVESYWNTPYNQAPPLTSLPQAQSNPVASDKKSIDESSFKWTIPAQPTPFQGAANGWSNVQSTSSVELTQTHIARVSQQLREQNRHVHAKIQMHQAQSNQLVQQTSQIQQPKKLQQSQHIQQIRPTGKMNQTQRTLQTKQTPVKPEPGTSYPTPYDYTYFNNGSKLYDTTSSLSHTPTVPSIDPLPTPITPSESSEAYFQSSSMTYHSSLSPSHSRQPSSVYSTHIIPKSGERPNQYSVTQGQGGLYNMSVQMPKGIVYASSTAPNGDIGEGSGSANGGGYGGDGYGDGNGGYGGNQENDGYGGGGDDGDGGYGAGGGSGGSSGQGGGDDRGDENDPNRPSNRRTPRGKKLALACHFCRRRKLKCDGRRPVCVNCEKRHIDCSYDENVRRRGPGKRTKEMRERAAREAVAGGLYDTAAALDQLSGSEMKQLGEQMEDFHGFHDPTQPHQPSHSHPTHPMDSMDPIDPNSMETIGESSLAQYHEGDTSLVDHLQEGTSLAEHLQEGLDQLRDQLPPFDNNDNYGQYPSPRLDLSMNIDESRMGEMSTGGIEIGQLEGMGLNHLRVLEHIDPTLRDDLRNSNPGDIEAREETLAQFDQLDQGSREMGNTLDMDEKDKIERGKGSRKRKSDIVRENKKPRQEVGGMGI